MNITKKWRIYDPADPRTHPKGLALIDIQFEDGNIFGVIRLAAAALCSKATGARIVGTIERWRYAS